MTATPAPQPTRTEPPEKETSKTSGAGAREMTVARDITDRSSNDPATRGNTRMTRSTGGDPLDAWYRAELAATMRPCPELSRADRNAKRAADEMAQESCPQAVDGAGGNAGSGSA